MTMIRPGAAAGSRPLTVPGRSTDTAALTPALLRECGEALYGPLWQSEMARQAGVAKRTVQRWAAGERAIPGAMRASLRDELLSRSGEVAMLLEQLGD